MVMEEFPLYEEGEHQQWEVALHRYRSVAKSKNVQPSSDAENAFLSSLFSKLGDRYYSPAKCPICVEEIQYAKVNNINVFAPTKEYLEAREQFWSTHSLRKPKVRTRLCSFNCTACGARNSQQVDG